VRYTDTIQEPGKGVEIASTAAASTTVVGVVEGPVAITGGAYTFTSTDVGRIVEGNSASTQTFTVPAFTYPLGSEIFIRQYGAGQITIAAGAGVTLRSRGGALKLVGQYAEAVLTLRASNEWVLSGDTSI